MRVWEDLKPGDADQAVGYGLPGGGDKFAIKLRGDAAKPPGLGFHLAFTGPTREAVALFHEAALRHGGVDNGPPGLRPHYAPDYFAAFVTDPDGYHIEVVAEVEG